LSFICGRVTTTAGLHDHGFSSERYFKQHPIFTGVCYHGRMEPRTMVVIQVTYIVGKSIAKFGVEFRFSGKSACIWVIRRDLFNERY